MAHYFKRIFKKRRPPAQKGSGIGPSAAGKQPVSLLLRMQRQVGNRAVQRLLAQRQSNNGGFELDESTTAQIYQALGRGQPLDPTLQESMGAKLNFDFSQVRIHTDAEADLMARQLGAMAFTVCHDIFFREGAYQPNTGQGQELIAHELTHVMQQTTRGICPPRGHSRLRVNAPNDASEQEAEAVSKTVTNGELANAQKKAAIDEESGALGKFGRGRG